MARDDRWALEATTDCVLLLDADLRVVYANRRAAALNGVAPEALVGCLHGEVWPQTVGTEVERRYREVMEIGHTTIFEHHYLGDVGPESWHEIHAYPYGGGVAVFFRDLTGTVRREAAARAERERLERALHAAGIGLWTRDLGTNALFWSPRMREHFGLPPDEAVGPDTFDTHVHPDDRNRALDAYRRALTEGVPYDAVYRTVGHDRRERTVHARGGAVYDDGVPVRFDGFTLDVTEREATERELREAQAQRNALLAAADIGAWTVDLETDTVVGDAKTLAMFGLEAASGTSVPADRIRAQIPAEDRETIRASFEEAVARGEVWSVEYRIACESGFRWVNARGVPERDPEGRLVRVPGVAVDVTALKAAERRQRFRVELMDALRGLSETREIVGAACRMVGEFLGVSRTTYGLVNVATGTIDTTTPYFHGVAPIQGVHRYADYGSRLLTEVEKGRPFAVSDTATDPLTRDGYATGFARMETRSFVVVPILRDGVPVATFSVQDRVPRVWTPEERELIENVARRVWDALERARAEEGLRALNAELESRVRARTAELERANEDLRAFTGAVSHDLRGPLRNIHGLGQMLLEDAADRLTAGDRRLLERQAHNALRLSAMVDALLSLARLGREPLNKEPFDLSDAATRVRDEFLARETQATCRIEVAPGMSAVGDRRLVKLVLLNLMENACKFSPKGGTVRVGQEPDGAFFVADEGVGFDMAHASKLFQPFERLVSEREFPGTGIGLANVRGIVERHGGRVWAESEPGKGATFRFTLG